MRDHAASTLRQQGSTAGRQAADSVVCTLSWSLHIRCKENTMKQADAPAMRFAVLGPVQVWRGETELVISSRYQRLLLALLLARTGRLVEMSDLIDLLWDGEPPPTAVNMVHRYVG